MKTYTKTHTSRKAANAHLEKIKTRGGIGVMKVEKRGYTIDYYFLPKTDKKKSKNSTAKKRYDVLDPDGRSIRKPGVPLFESKKASVEYFDEWMKQFHRQGYWSPTKGSIITSKLKRHCKFIELK